MTCLSFPPSIDGQSVIMTLVSGGCPVPLRCASLPHTHTNTQTPSSVLLCVVCLSVGNCMKPFSCQFLQIMTQEKKNTFSCTHATFSFRTGLGNMLHLRKWFNITSILSVLWWSHISKWLDWISSCIAIMLFLFFRLDTFLVHFSSFFFFICLFFVLTALFMKQIHFLVQGLPKVWV